MKKLKRTVLLTPLILPVLFYPFVLIANVMSLAGYAPADMSLIQYVVPQFFLWASTLYPFVVGYLLFKWKKSLSGIEEVRYMYYAYGYAVLCILFFYLWLYVD